MALSSCPVPVLIGDSTLGDWRVIGSGGFGQIYKARHLQWGWDVAIKLLHYDDGNRSSLLYEADKMRQGGSPFVLRVLGVFQGRPPSSETSTRLGLVMEFMERGSLAFLQETLCGPPPWPLAFRLAHQVALGMNYLHCLSPPILHLDLKPSNVLLDPSLNVKLTDFGLARYYHSVTRGSGNKEEGGTISYMPPEAFDISYYPTLASDIYSYGILLWSVVMGKEPYPYAISSMVRLRIPQGDRPSTVEINPGRAEGLRDLVVLMERCWDMKPTQRPSFRECSSVTEKLYEKHRNVINYAIHQVLLKLDQQEEERRPVEGVGLSHVTRQLESPKVTAQTVTNNVPMGFLPTQEMADSLKTPQRNKTSGKGQPTLQPSRAFRRGSSGSSSKVPGPSTSQDRKMKPSPLSSRPNQFGGYQRQFSNPEASRHKPNPHPTGGVSISMSNVMGIQLGNDNVMYIHNMGIYERRRHPTAPSSVNIPPPNSGSHRGKTGNVG
ncbi:receptor-interacting serine/threonine-protein kinase 3 [Lampris incognitus]|uniref:receptor-interacting serine/threonine-protein kinase 3 n=1 Tax=Lampris incognitus TaxID=2546036 RepID=UPI0024B5900C|nr:receptor-interacting serine/threonine-protein kinase 3 [Lampris incognitus]